MPRARAPRAPSSCARSASTTTSAGTARGTRMGSPPRPRRCLLSSSGLRLTLKPCGRGARIASLTRTQILSELEKGAGAQWGTRARAHRPRGDRKRRPRLHPSESVATQSPAANHKSSRFLLARRFGGPQSWHGMRSDRLRRRPGRSTRRDAVGARELCGAAAGRSLVLSDQHLPDVSGPGRCCTASGLTVPPPQWS